MTIEITYGPDQQIAVHGDHVTKVPPPGFTCPQCAVQTLWVQALMDGRLLRAYCLPLCGHEFEAQRWELLCRDDEWSLTPRVMSRTSWTDDRLHAWEHVINETFQRLGSSERVCAHLDRTITLYGSGSRLMECDYCASYVYLTDPRAEQNLPPSYYLDPVPA